MTEHIRGTKRSRGRQINATHSSSIGCTTHEDNHQSQPLQHPSDERVLSYPSTWISPLAPNRMALASLGRHGERKTQPPCPPGSCQGDATDMGPFHRYQDGLQPTWQQATQLPYTQRIPHDPLFWNPQSRYVAPDVDAAKVQCDQSWQGELYRVDDLNEVPGYNAYHPQFSPQNQNITEYSSQAQGTDPYVSLFPDHATAYQSTSSINRSYDLSGMPPTLTTRASVSSEHANIESIMDVIGEIGTGANSDPWSPYQPKVMPQMFQQGYMSQGTHRKGTSDTTPSWRRISSCGMANNGMDARMLAKRPEALNNQAPREPALCSSSLSSAPLGPAFLLRQATPPVGRSKNDTYNNFSDTVSSRINPALLFLEKESMTSGTPSYASDASSPAASFEIHCDVEGCDTVFNGIHRNGNLARHKRLKHRGPKVYICADDSCEKVYNRQDARLKHYRKRHPRLASKFLARPQTRRANREQHSDFLSSVSG